LQRKLAELAPGNAASNTAKSPPNVSPGKAALLRRLGGNARLVQPIVRTFRRDAPKKIAEMKRALARKDGIALATAAHALKGSASLFGAEKATLGAQQLQEMGRKGELEHARTVLKELEEAVAHLREELRGYDASGGGKAKARKRRRNLNHKRAKRSR
jgi:HPt (histidine-containing phosphotransfer) domain-containing protein